MLELFEEKDLTTEALTKTHSKRQAMNSQLAGLKQTIEALFAHSIKLAHLSNQPGLRKQPSSGYTYAGKKVRFAANDGCVTGASDVGSNFGLKTVKGIITRMADSEDMERTYSTIQKRAESLHLAKLRSGALLTRLSKHGQLEERWFSLSADGSELQWTRPWANTFRNKKGVTNFLIPEPKKRLLTEAVSIYFGFDHPRSNFQYYLPLHIPPWLCVTILFRRSHLDVLTAFDLIFPSTELLEVWLLGIQDQMVMNYYHLSRPQIKWRRATWRFYRQLYEEESDLPPLNYLAQLVKKAKDSIANDPKVKNSSSSVEFKQNVKFYTI